MVCPPLSSLLYGPARLRFRALRRELDLQKQQQEVEVRRSVARKRLAQNTTTQVWAATIHDRPRPLTYHRTDAHHITASAHSLCGSIPPLPRS